MSGNCIAITDLAFRPRAPLLSTLGLADYGIPENVFNQLPPCEEQEGVIRYGVADVVCCTSEAASQHVVALQQRFILVVLR